MPVGPMVGSLLAKSLDVTLPDRPAVKSSVVRLQGVRFYILGGKHSIQAALRLMSAADAGHDPKEAEIKKQYEHRECTIWNSAKMGPGDWPACIGKARRSSGCQVLDCEAFPSYLHLSGEKPQPQIPPHGILFAHTDPSSLVTNSALLWIPHIFVIGPFML